MFNLTDIWNAITNVGYRDPLDFLVVFIIVYGLLKLVRGTRGVQVAFGVVVVAAIYQVAKFFNFRMVETILRLSLSYFWLAAIVIFQSEIRAALTHLGKTLRNPLLLRDRVSAPTDNFDEVVLAATTLASRKIGALIVLERTVGLQNWIDTGVNLDATLTYDLLVTVFDPHTPMHDGAVIIRNNRAAAASCFLPLTLNPRLSKELGTRHRAAIGITEDSDCIAVVVSEETGTISFVNRGQIQRNLDSVRLRALLKDAFAPPRPIGAVVPKRKRRRKKKKKQPDIDTTAEMASEMSSSGG